MQNKDTILSFTFKDIDVRAKIINLDKVAKKLIDRFNSIKEINNLMLESVALSNLIASNFKFDGFFKLQLNCYNGIVKVLLCNCSLQGEVNAYLSVDNEKLIKYSALEHKNFSDLIGEGYILFHLDQNLGVPYQAIVAMDNKSLESSANYWFLQSEQIPTYLRFFTFDNEIYGLFLQSIPNINFTEEQKNNALQDFINLKNKATLLTNNDFLQKDLPSILSSMNQEKELMILDIKELKYKCFCNSDQIQAIFDSMSKEEIEQIREENNGLVEIECSFCGTKYTF